MPCIVRWSMCSHVQRRHHNGQCRSQVVKICARMLLCSWCVSREPNTVPDVTYPLWATVQRKLNDRLYLLFFLCIISFPPGPLSLSESLHFSWSIHICPPNIGQSLPALNVTLPQYTVTSVQQKIIHIKIQRILFQCDVTEPAFEGFMAFRHRH